MDLRPSILDDLGLLDDSFLVLPEISDDLFDTSESRQEIGIEEAEIPACFEDRHLPGYPGGDEQHRQTQQGRLVSRCSCGRWTRRMELILQDNGHGFNLEEVLGSESTKRGLGLTSMRERVELSGGSFAIESSEGKGTTVRASWPIGV